MTAWMAIDPSLSTQDGKFSYF